MAEKRQSAAGDAQSRQDRGPETDEGVSDSGETFEPTMPQVNRSRAQGLGVGQKELNYQRDPTRAASADRYGKKQ